MDVFKMVLIKNTHFPAAQPVGAEGQHAAIDIDFSSKIKAILSMKKSKKSKKNKELEAAQNNTNISELNFLH